MKLSDYIAQFLIGQACTHAFGYQGGAVTHLIDSLYAADGIRFIGCGHEQAAAFAAEGYARVTGRCGVAIATSGPGATNLITGIGSAYFDSIPCVYLTGQVNTYEYKGALPVRQLGFQETDIVSVVTPIVKYAVRITDPRYIRYELERAFYTAQAGRKGPVLLDIPMDIQRAQVEEETLSGYEPEPEARPLIDMAQVIEALNSSRRPVLLAGGGVRLSGGVELLNALAQSLHIPVVTSLMGRDAIDNTFPEFCGMLGSYGNRYANLTVANSDLVLAIGTRLDTRQTGTLPQSFAREAKLIRVDIDPNELKHTIKPDEISIEEDAKTFLEQLRKEARRVHSDWSAWHTIIAGYKARYPSFMKPKFSDPNYLVSAFGSFMDGEETICLDVGQNQMWGAQSLLLNARQRLLTSGGMGAMGFSLPCAIGAQYAAPDRKIIAFVGDGGMQINIQELALLKREHLPVKVIVLNNRSLGMIRHFQEMYFSSRYAGTVKDYEAPDFCAIASAYGIQNLRVERMEDLNAVRELLDAPEPAVIEVTLPQHTYVFPKLSVNRPIEELEPPVEEAQFLRDMIVAPFQRNSKGE